MYGVLHVIFRLSSVSSALHAAASTTYDDFVKARFPHLEEDQEKAARVGKALGKILRSFDN